MTRADSDRWGRLQGARRTSDFVRHLLDLAEEELGRQAASDALVVLLRVREQLPGEWSHEWAWACDSLGADVGQIAMKPGHTLDIGQAIQAGAVVGPR